ncbi:hypothetical protein YC2023_098828 [Brassica napus]
MRKICKDNKRVLKKLILFRIRVRALRSLQKMIKALAARAVSELHSSSNLKRLNLVESQLDTKDEKDWKNAAYVPLSEDQAERSSIERVEQEIELLVIGCQS